MPPANVRTVLEQERERLRGVLSRSLVTADDLCHPVGEAGVDLDLADAATAQVNREVAETLEVEMRAQLEEVEAALARLDAGAYGRCEVGGEAIPAARLRARPTARTCVAHAGSDLH